ncbi:MAG TPA: hypothetical protein PKN33_08155 [Phycisphaerae bacterium]|nr:hypothetical protein [Phycisphaerae bacterium]
MRRMILLLLPFCLSVGARAAGPTIAEQLDAGLTIRLEEMPIVDAFKQLAASAEINIAVSDEAIKALPYGDRTKITIVLSDATVRMGLDAISNQLALTYDVSGESVVVQPMPALRRIGRTASWNEIDTLTQLHASDWSDTDAVKQHLSDRLRFRGIDGDFETNWKKLQSAINPKREGPIDAALTEGCDACGWTWYPEGKQVVVLPLKEQVARQLERIISIKHYGEALASILQDLSRLAGVPIEMKGSAASTLPLEVKESFTLVADGVSVREAIAQITLAADLDHVIRDDKVILVRSDRVGPPTERRRWNNAIVGAVRVPSQDGGFTYDWFIRESDLTPEENAKRELQVKEAIEAMKKDLAKVTLPEEN